MRKAEKNYFLYHDINSLIEAYNKGKFVAGELNKNRKVLIHILTKKIYNTLNYTLNNYLTTLQKIKRSPKDKKYTSSLREYGHKLTDLSIHLIKRERKKINKIIHHVTLMILMSLFGIFLAHMLTWRYFSYVLTKKLIKMKKMTNEVAQGRFHEVSLIQSKIKDNVQDEVGIVITAISKMAKELEKREEQLLQAKKLVSLGVLISGVAHELGNPLNNISMLSEGFLTYYDSLSDEEKKKFMQDIQEQADRIKKIVRNLLDFSRQKKPELKVCKLEEVIEKSLALVENQLKISNIKVHKNFPSSLPNVQIDEDQIQQVLVNLYTNAMQAMSKGGDLFIDVFTSDTKNNIIIKVRDTGIGINPETLPHIFDPFFTTKGTKGTGLGLSVSYGIIRQHNGKISVESEQEKGTTFTIELPVYQENKEE